ncbi:MAG: XrtA/PEP-CTERM system amidotransferase [Erythrobacter sp.]
MCGIAGIIAQARGRPVDAALVGRMTDTLAHRGPDGSGVWSAPGIALGHRRLAIIDLAGSKQPMVSADGRFVITFNGEIYNYRELRRELQGEGFAFQTTGDTEVILAAYARWGTGCLERLDGMFAFVLYDDARGEVLLARDRLGVKPLYYAPLGDGSLAFASEMKGLLAHPMLARRVSREAVDAFLAWGYVPDRHAILEGVHKLPAGHFWRFEVGKARGCPQRWWDIDFTQRESAGEAELAEELLRLMQAAVKSRMVADVPLGAFLSGGVDSSSLVALMRETSGAGALQTCSIGFDVAGVDETAYARRVAAQFGTDHHERIVGRDDFAAVNQIAAMFDEPFADPSALPTWRVCQLARERVSVALSGDGADESFAGYRRQVFHHHEEQVRALVPQALRRGVFGTLGRIYPKADWAPRPLRAKATLLALAETGEEGYARALAAMNPAARHALYTPGFAKELGDFRAEDALIALMREAPAQSGLDRAQYADLMFWLPGDILTKVDRTSMAVSLEAREPLLDHRLIAFAARLPEALRVRGRTGKYLLKRTMETRLPRDILYRPKQGFVTPVAEWLRGPLAGAARAIAGSGVLAETGFFSQPALARLAEAHIAGRRDNARALWQLMMLEKSLTHLGVSG